MARRNSAHPLPSELTRRSPMTGYGSKFTRNKEKAIAALIRQPTMAAAAKEAGINTKTVQRWRRMPEFEEAYRQARRDNFSQLTAGFQQTCPLALGTLLTVMTDGKAPPAIKVRTRLILKFWAPCPIDGGGTRPVKSPAPVPPAKS